MAMFPLGMVLLPGGVLPLRVFEPRYRQLVRDCLADNDHEFGVVLIDRGHEVGGGDIRCMVGTVAKMVQVAETMDGQFALVTVGTRRIRVREWVPDDPYPRADVEDWPDEWPDDGLDDGLDESADDLLDDVLDGAAQDDGDPSALADLRGVIATMSVRVRRVCALAAELGGAAVDVMAEVSDDPLLASYHLCGLAPIGPADRQKLLEAPGPTERLAMLSEVLDDIEALLNFRLQHPSSGSGGGHDADFGDFDDPSDLGDP